MVQVRQVWRKVAIGVLAAGWSMSLPGNEPDVSPDTFEALRSADLQLASIGFRLSTAAVPLCDRKQPGTGLQLHTLAQYSPDTRENARAHFDFQGSVAVEGVVAGSPAAEVGIRADDTVISINGIATPAGAGGEATTGLLAELHRRLAQLPPAEPIDLIVLRDGQRKPVTLTPLPACLTRFELRIDDSFDARANGELVQITSKYVAAIDPKLLPAVIAHELSHNILNHRERLEAAGAGFGFASGFGRNVGLFRQTELEADILAVHILARAGYSPDLAARFWTEAGPLLLAGKMRRRSHPPLRHRVAVAKAEAAKFRNGGGLAPLPAFFARRTEALDGEWRGLLPNGRR